MSQRLLDNLQVLLPQQQLRQAVAQQAESLLRSAERHSKNYRSGSWCKANRCSLTTPKKNSKNIPCSKPIMLTKQPISCWEAEEGLYQQLELLNHTVAIHYE